MNLEALRVLGALVHVAWFRFGGFIGAWFSGGSLVR